MITFRNPSIILVMLNQATATIGTEKIQCEQLRGIGSELIDNVAVVKPIFDNGSKKVAHQEMGISTLELPDNVVVEISSIVSKQYNN